MLCYVVLRSATSAELLALLCCVLLAVSVELNGKDFDLSTQRNFRFAFPCFLLFFPRKGAEPHEQYDAFIL